MQPVGLLMSGVDCLRALNTTTQSIPPEQLRAASEREIAIESLKGPIEIPWTITSLATIQPVRRMLMCPGISPQMKSMLMLQVIPLKAGNLHPNARALWYQKLTHKEFAAAQMTWT